MAGGAQGAAAEAAPAVQVPPGDFIMVVETVARITLPAEPASLGALLQSTTDVSQTLADVTSQTGISSVASHPTPESQGVTSLVQASGIIRIIFKRP